MPSPNSVTERLLSQLKQLDRYGREGFYTEVAKDHGASFAALVRAEFDKRNGAKGQ